MKATKCLAAAAAAAALVGLAPGASPADAATAHPAAGASLLCTFQYSAYAHRYDTESASGSCLGLSTLGSWALTGRPSSLDEGFSCPATNGFDVTIGDAHYDLDWTPNPGLVRTLTFGQLGIPGPEVLLGSVSGAGSGLATLVGTASCEIGVYSGSVMNANTDGTVVMTLTIGAPN